MEPTSELELEKVPKKKASRKPRVHNEVYRDTSRCGLRKDGTIIKHDCWRADITVIDDDGTMRRVRKRFKTEEEARAFLNEVNMSKAKAAPKKATKRKKFAKKTTKKTSKKKKTTKKVRTRKSTTNK